jgi:hypothetical protein
MSTQRPYISISGITLLSEIEKLNSVAGELQKKYNAEHSYVNGILVSSKTLRGDTNKWPQRYPKVNTIASMLSTPPQPNAYNLVHFNTDEPWDLFRSLVYIKGVCGPHLHGLQLNITWPSIDSIRLYRMYHPDAKIIVQVGGKALESMNNNPTRIAQAIASYQGVANYALLDPSGGKGIPFDTLEMQRYLDAIYYNGIHEHIGIGIAGGLTARTVGATIDHFFSRYPNLSIDVEGNVRNADDTLNVSSGALYLENAYKAFNKTKTEAVAHHPV